MTSCRDAKGRYCRAHGSRGSPAIHGKGETSSRREEAPERRAPGHGQDANIIRGYGPGKFSSVIDSYSYDASTDSGGETIGDVSEMGEAATPIEVDVARYEELARENGDELTPAEREYLGNHPYAIVFEDSQGFVSVEYFEHKEPFERAVAHAESAAEDFYADENTDESDYPDNK